MKHPRRLPRTEGYAGGDSVSVAIMRALRTRGVCEAFASRCMTRRADTLELYFAAEAFGPDRGPRPVALRFEKIHQLVHEDDAWRVAREARVETR